MLVDSAPNIERSGVVAGFVLTPGGGLAPAISKGVLFAQGTIYRPAAAPALPGAAASQQSWLFYNSVAGFYWAAAPVPVDAADAFLGWVVTSASDVLALSRQQIVVPDQKEKITVIPLGPVLPAGGGKTSFGDTDVPPLPNFGINTSGRGTLELLGISFPTLENTRSIESVTFKVLYQDETAAAAGRLTADVDAVTQTFAVDNGAAYSVGNLYLIDRELVKVTAINGNNLTAARGQNGSIAAAHAGPKSITGATNATPIVLTAAGHLRVVNDVVEVSGVGGDDGANGNWEVASPTTNTLALNGSSGSGAYTSGGQIAGARLFAVQEKVAIFAFEPLFFTLAAATNWRGLVELLNARVCTLIGWFTNAFGDSPVFTGDGLQATTRTLMGGQIDLEVEGVLGIQSDAVPAITAPAAAAVSAVFAYVKTAPTGAAIRVVVKVNGTAWATCVIQAGQTSATASQSGRALGPLAPGAQITLDITAVGTTFPGERLSVQIKL